MHGVAVLALVCSLTSTCTMHLRPRAGRVENKHRAKLEGLLLAGDHAEIRLVVLCAAQFRDGVRPWIISWQRRPRSKPVAELGLTAYMRPLTAQAVSDKQARSHPL